MFFGSRIDGHHPYRFAAPIRHPPSDMLRSLAATGPASQPLRGSPARRRGMTIPFLPAALSCYPNGAKPTVFEAAIKTVSHNNVAWRTTVRMVNALGSNSVRLRRPALMRSRLRRRWRLDPRPSIGRPFAPGTGALTSTRSRRASLREPSLSRRSAPRVISRRRGRGAPARSARNRPVRRRASHDASRAALTSGPRLVDEAEVRAGERSQSERRHGRATVPPLREVQRPWPSGCT